MVGLGMLVVCVFGGGGGAVGVMLSPNNDVVGSGTFSFLPLVFFHSITFLLRFLFIFCFFPAAAIFCVPLPPPLSAYARVCMLFVAVFSSSGCSLDFVRRVVDGDESDRGRLHQAQGGRHPRSV